MLGIYKIMLFFTLKTIFISLLLIALIHYLYGFFKNTLTVPKVKDLVNKPTNRYNEMFAVINGANQPEHKREKEYNSPLEQSMGQQSMVMGQQSMGQQSMGQQSMQAELKNFLKDLKKPDVNKFSTSTRNASKGAGAFSSLDPGAGTVQDTGPSNFPAANESAFGSYTPF